LVLRAFPEAGWDDDAEFRRITEIKEKAFGSSFPRGAWTR
jgi:hypothetical protein